MNSVYSYTANIPAISTYPSTQPITEKCISCNRVCSVSKIFVAYDQDKNKNVYACSTMCKNSWSRTCGDSTVIRSNRTQHGPSTPHYNFKSTTNPRLSPPRNSNCMKKTDNFAHFTKNSLVKSSMSSTTTNSTTSRKPFQFNLNEPIYAIIDTNCLLQHLSEILNLKNHPNVTVVIPNIVIHELDGIKKNANDIGFQSRIALKSLQESFENINFNNDRKWLLGQQVYEVLPEENSSFNQYRNNDDQILNCALYYNKFVAYNKVAIITADSTLCIKAMNHQIFAFSVEKFFSALPARSYTYQITSDVKELQTQPKKEVVVSNNQHITAALLPHFPPAIWERIVEFLPPRSLGVVSTVCFQFYEMLKNDKIWKNSIRRTFNDTNDVLIPKNTSAKSWYLKWKVQVFPIATTNNSNWNCETTDTSQLSQLNSSL